MKRVCIYLGLFLGLLLGPASCGIFGKLSVKCDGDCDDPSFLVDGETGMDVTYSNWTNNITYDQHGQISTVTFSGTIIYNDSGNSYEVEGVSNHSPCSYNLTVSDADGNEATCSN